MKNVTVYKPTRNGTFEQLFSDALGVPESEVESALRGRVFTDAQIDEILKNGEKNGIEMTGWGNFFPILENGKVSVVHVYRFDGRWSRGVSSLGDGCVWHCECRLVLSNSDTKTLEPSVPSDLEARLKKLEALFSPDLLK